MKDGSCGRGRRIHNLMYILLHIFSHGNIKFNKFANNFRYVLGHSLIVGYGVRAVMLCNAERGDVSEGHIASVFSVECELAFSA
jgi:hypothetical protein